MKRIFFVLFLIAAVVGTMVLPVPTTASTMSTITKGDPLNVNDFQMTGYTVFSTPTITWSAASTAVRMPTPPAGTIGVIAIASGSVNYGDSTVKDDAVGAYPTLADEAEKVFQVYPNVRPDIWFVPTASGSGVCVVRFIAITQK